MNKLQLIITALVLSTDSFTVAFCRAAVDNSSIIKKIMSIGLLFALAEMISLGLGWFLGHKISNLIQDIDHWIAFIILTFLGVKILIDGFKPLDIELKAKKMSFVATLLSAIATSIDSWVMGISLALTKTPLLTVYGIFIPVNLTTSILAILLSKWLIKHFGVRLKILAGIIMIIIAVFTLQEHGVY